MIEMIKVLFFDFDGTISDAKKIAYESMVEALEEYNYKFDKKKLSKLMGSKVEIILKELGLENKNLRNVRKTFYKYFTKAALDGGIKPCVSLRPLYKLKKDYPLIVISNSEKDFLKASIKELKIGGLFKEIYGAEEFKKKSEALKKLFKKMKIKSGEAIYIGDRFSDVRYAKEAGCVSVAIHNKCSWSILRIIKKENPDYIIKNFSELEKLISKINRV